MGNRSTHVYAVALSPDGPCKLGRASDLYARFQQIQTANLSEITLACACQPTTLTAAQAERAMHQRFFDRHMRGEWFNITVAEAREAMAEYGILINEIVWERPHHRRGADPVTALAAMQCHPRWKKAR